MTTLSIRLFIIVLLCTLADSTIYCQEKTIIKKFPETGTHHYEARDAIYFKAGYSFTSDEGTTMSATINPDLECYTEYLNIYSLPDLDQRELDKSLPVGSTNGGFDVSPTGGATYQIPIFTPPGTAGMQPQISIAYNSQSGNGLLGMGWNITGLSAITRVPKNYYFDNMAGGISLTSEDQLSLDGNRLLYKSGTYGEIGATYYTEVEGFNTISSLTSTVTGLQYIKVETRDGKILEYGNTEDSYVNATTNIALMYRLNKVTDVFGNYIKYTYKEVSGESYISSIEYTGNENAGLAPYNKIQFYYEKKNDPKTYYIAGKPIPETVILYKISVPAKLNGIHIPSFPYLSIP